MEDEDPFIFRINIIAADTLVPCVDPVFLKYHGLRPEMLTHLSLMCQEYLNTALMVYDLFSKILFDNDLSPIIAIGPHFDKILIHICYVRKWHLDFFSQFADSRKNWVKGLT